MSESFFNGRVTLHAGDSRDVLKTLANNSIDSIVTDPPYALVSIVKRFANSPRSERTENTENPYGRTGRGFMGQRWDNGETAFATEFWAECLRVLKPGGHVVSFSGTRTYHRMACAIEDAGFEVRDQIGWAFGQGFPKSHNAGDGWGTALKPAWEPIMLARKALIGTVAANVLEHGTGAINIDGCRVGIDASDDIFAKNPHTVNQATNDIYGAFKAGSEYKVPAGRWPANIIHDGSEDVIAAFPNTETNPGTLRSDAKTGDIAYAPIRSEGTVLSGGDAGSAARFFYTAKADASDRIGSKHPTVKPVDLMQWLVRLVTPKGGLVLDPFAGTGTTGEAAFREGMRSVLIEREEEYQADIRRRMALCMSGPDERKRESIKAKLGDVPFEPGSLFA